MRCFLLLFGILLVSCTGKSNDVKVKVHKVSVNKIDVKKTALDLFNKEIPMLKSGEMKGEIFDPEILIGDINNDGLKDAVVWYSLVPGAEGGNYHMKEGICAYVNTGRSVKKVSEYTVDDVFTMEAIENGKIKIIRYQYAEHDYPKFPSIEITKYLVLRNNKLEELK